MGMDGQAVANDQVSNAPPPWLANTVTTSYALLFALAGSPCASATQVDFGPSGSLRIGLDIWRNRDCRTWSWSPVSNSRL